MILKNKITKIVATVFVFSLFAFGQSADAQTSEEPKTQMITVISPNGGESYNRGQSISYKWNQVLKTTKLEVSVINASTSTVVYTAKRFDSKGDNRKFIAGTATASISAGQYKLKICDVALTTPVCDTSNESFTITSTVVTPDDDNDKPNSQQITVKSPSNGDSFAQGKNIPYNWEQEKNSKYIEVSLIFASTSEVEHTVKRFDGRGNNAKVIMGKTTADLPVGEYKMRICDLAREASPVCDENTGVFNITDGTDNGSSTKKAQTIEIKTPNGGESYDRGERISYQWRQKTKARNLKISVINATSSEEVYTAKRFDGGGLNKKIITPVATAKIPAGQYLLRICDKVSDTKDVCDKSDAPFTITNALRTIVEKDRKPEEITIKSPNGGETFTRGQKIPYEWNQTRNAKEIEISLINASSSVAVYTATRFEGHGNNKKTILGEATASVAPGQYKLEICNLATSACDLSNLPFTIN